MNPQLPTTDNEQPRTALPLMDLQEAILRNYPDKDALLERIRMALAAARRAGMPVIWVRVCFRPGYPEVSANNKLFAGIRKEGRLRDGDPDSEIHPSLDVQSQDTVVTKRRIGAFAGSDLDVVLRAGGIQALVLAGVSTSGVVLSTVRLAADLDFSLTVLSTAAPIPARKCIACSPARCSRGRRACRPLPIGTRRSCPEPPPACVATAHSQARRADTHPPAPLPTPRPIQARAGKVPHNPV